MHDLDRRFQAACAVAREAAAAARRLFRTRQGREFELKGPQDYFAAADGEIELEIRRHITGKFPEDAFFGEEGEERSVGDCTWVVDPIDGTANFVRGIPHFAISVALLYRGQPALGIVAVPMTRELFAARRGAGATVNGERIAVSGVTDLSRATVELGWSTRRPVSDYARLVERVARAGAGTRNAGSAALALANLAAGRLDAYCELHVNAWDCLAGIVLAREAGGWASDFLEGSGLLAGNALLACTPGVREQLVEVTDVGASSPIDAPRSCSGGYTGLDLTPPLADSTAQRESASK